ncbi:MAG: HAD family hydrolase [Chloroflexi bacterium AL-W]|nr:HAD family hydrolase [Chloroflexi bacterium AL-N1]NOK67611.1 HAD family hydrolase [Chloroflexi bacterium AL-N10]NOK75619.1 HAD family hydrolase [Chloroflexi bacterium AL-N5]NOK82407.1 HAD family hydrolase [Chloroflexi bacterium AL-W]NOK90252.1 HAD family hydrolase [Chloroflexi bacterium AL-N15]
MNKLILWDIDGTLLYGGGASGEIMRSAMEQTYGAPFHQERISYAGKTDQQIILDTFPHQSDTELLGQLDHFTTIYVEEFHKRTPDFLSRGQILEGVSAALEQLSTQPVIQSVLTGNIRAIAHLKLELMALTQYFDLRVGAYGSDHPQRAQLVPMALARAEQHYGRQFVQHNAIIVGDTPNDIACGQASGVRTVAVASGPFSVEQLRSHNPDAVLSSLADTDAVLKAMLG